MRDDFAKLLVLTGRSGSTEKYKLHRAYNKKNDYERAPSKQGMRRPYNDRKSFDEYLNPLKGFLAKNVNRPWDKVYSELCKSLTGGSTIIQHVKQHLFQYVELNVMYFNNVPYHRPFWNYKEMAPGQLYVDRYGILRKARKVKQRAFKQDNDRVMINPFEDYIKVSGVWFHVWFGLLPEAFQCNVGHSLEDAFYGKMTVVKFLNNYTQWNGVAQWRLDHYGLVPSGEYVGRKRYAKKKLQVSAREIKEENLNK